MVLALVIRTTSTMAAGYGTAISYQGYLVDSSSPASGNYDFEFRLYDAETGGSQVGSTITVDDLSVSDGKFLTNLDFGANIFDSTDLWLETSVRVGSDSGAYTALSPRSQIAATAYAMYAEDADADTGNEWNTALNLNDTTLQVTDANAIQSANLSALVADRTPIGSLPYTINVSGSYYFTDTLVGTADTDGITIAADDVVIDLMGFPLQGGGGSSGSGITASGAYTNVHIYNGAITGWAEAGIDAGTINNGIFQRLRLSSNGGDGLTAGENAVVTIVTTYLNSGNGVRLGPNGTVNLVTTYDNSLDGIQVGDGSSVTESTAFTNDGNGIEGGTSISVVNCVVTDSVQNGISVGDGSTIQGSSAYDNMGSGFAISGSTSVRENIAALNNGDGFTVSGDGNVLRHNKTHENDLNGITVSGNNNRIESNSLTDNDVEGLGVTGTGNLIVRNAAAGNVNSSTSVLTNYNIGAGNIAGPIQDVTGVGEFNTTQPFTNFEY